MRADTTAGRDRRPREAGLPVRDSRTSTILPLPDAPVGCGAATLDGSAFFAQLARRRADEELCAPGALTLAPCA